MFRRRFLQTGAALAAAAVPWPALPGAPGPHPGLKRLGAAAPFDYARLKGMARTMAGAAYQSPPSELPPAIAKLNWDQWQAIRFRDDRALWLGADLRFRVELFHLGFTIRKPVRIYTVENSQAQELSFDPAMFDYSRSGVDARSLPPTMGFAGFRLLFHGDWKRDIAAFQGASYFRAVDGDMQYGMSQRGLAIDCGSPHPEEFPDFIAYYLEQPPRDSSQLTVYGLLDSPSVAGAYRFVIDVGDTIVMDIDAALYPRKVIDRLGIAPGTSMFLCGPNDRRVDADWRPAIHDSDGLQMHTGAGEWLWRPLVNSPTVRVNTYADEAPRGFGLMQRDRNFDHYQDDGVFYNRRPSTWIEPKGSWGRGSVTLVEIPATDETFDNIVAFWNPQDKPQRGQELLFGYRLYWCRFNPAYCPLAQVDATRDGIGGVVGQKHAYFSWRFVVDFAGGDFPLLGEGAHIEPVITASRGTVEITSARPLHAISGWRAMFDLKLTDDSPEPINLRLYLALDGQPLTETWIYQYTPPPADQRHL
ncbi:MAG TPA: glucan biosynthesis protein D [Steroidobacteraceae bacterium]